jgi:SM-20-related protein
VIRFETLAGAVLNTDPYRWAHVDGWCDEAALRELSGSFPASGFTVTRRERGSDKRYLMAARVARCIDGLVRTDGLAAVWRDLLGELCSESYRAALSRLTGTELSGHLYEIGFYRYGRGGFVSPHCDKPGKSVGHVLYFNPTWDDRWGGEFRILRGDDPSAVVHATPPTAGGSVVLVRSESSWHAVDLVTGPRERLAVHVDFYRDRPVDDGLRQELDRDGGGGEG